MRSNNADNYMAYVKGWTAGAGCRVIDPIFQDHENDNIKEAYMDGWGDGRSCRSVAFRAAEKIYGYSPSVIRPCDIGTTQESRDE